MLNRIIGQKKRWIENRSSKCIDFLQRKPKKGKKWNSYGT